MKKYDLSLIRQEFNKRIDKAKDAVHVPLLKDGENFDFTDTGEQIIIMTDQFLAEIGFNPSTGLYALTLNQQRETSENPSLLPEVLLTYFQSLKPDQIQLLQESLKKRAIISQKETESKPKIEEAKIKVETSPYVVPSKSKIVSKKTAKPKATIEKVKPEFVWENQYNQMNPKEREVFLKNLGINDSDAKFYSQLATLDYKFDPIRTDIRDLEKNKAIISKVAKIEPEIKAKEAKPASPELSAETLLKEMMQVVSEPEKEHAKFAPFISPADLEKITNSIIQSFNDIDKIIISAIQAKYYPNRLSLSQKFEEEKKDNILQNISIPLIFESGLELVPRVSFSFDRDNTWKIYAENVGKLAKIDSETYHKFLENIRKRLLEEIVKAPLAPQPSQPKEAPSLRLETSSSPAKEQKGPKDNPELIEAMLMSQAKKNPANLKYAIRQHQAEKRGLHLDLTIGLESEPEVADFYFTPNFKSLEDIKKMEGTPRIFPFVPHDTSKYLKPEVGYGETIAEGFGAGTWKIIAKGSAVQKGSHHSFTLINPAFSLLLWRPPTGMWLIKKIGEISTETKPKKSKRIKKESVEKKIESQSEAEIKKEAEPQITPEDIMREMMKTPPVTPYKKFQSELMAQIEEQMRIMKKDIQTIIVPKFEIHWNEIRMAVQAKLLHENLPPSSDTIYDTILQKTSEIMQEPSQAILKSRQAPATEPLKAIKTAEELIKEMQQQLLPAK